MAARAIWKGVVTFGSVELPVKLYSAAQDQKVHFRLLHAKDREPVEQRMVHPETGEVVPKEEVRRGYEVEPGTFVVLDDEDLEAAKPEKSRTIEITRFVPKPVINHPWYDRPYYLGPDGEVAGDYFALAQALEAEEREGVARWTMRNKEYVGALRSIDGYLVLISMRYAGEVVSASQLPAPAGRDLNPKEVSMAEQLVSMLEDDFRPGDFRNEYQDRVRELIETKARGGEVKVKKFVRKKPSDSLAGMLEASLQGAKKRAS